MVSVGCCYSVRTNGEGWFRMHPPMHALYHLPNLVSHPTPRPISKPTPWRTWASKRAAFGQQRAHAADPFVPGFLSSHFGPHPTPTHCCVPQKLSSVPLACMSEPTSMHACSPENVLHCALVALQCHCSLFDFTLHATLHTYMLMTELMTCGLLHAIHACAHA